MATDKRLDQVSNLTDFDYALIVKGTDVAKVTKQQLAELVGNLLYGATTKETLASVVAGIINKDEDLGIKVIPKKGAAFAKILHVPKLGRTTILLSLSRYSNTGIVIALVTVYPVHTTSKVIVNYIHGSKNTSDNYSVKMYYVIESDESISLYVTTANYEDCGYRVISNYLGDTAISEVASVPDGVVQI